MHLALAIFAVTLVACQWGVLGQPSPPQGISVGIAIWPLTATQCEPFLIFFNNTDTTEPVVNAIVTPDSTTIATITYPPGFGYMNWICNIPAGQTFYLFVPGNLFYYEYPVQSGSSSACLGALSTTYQYLDFSTSVFQTYTSHSYSNATSVPVALASTTYPTGLYNTITVDPDVAIRATATPSSSSFTSSSSLASSSSSTSTSSLASSTALALSSSPHKSNTLAIVGGAVGAAVFLFCFGLFLRARSKTRRMTTPAVGSQPTDAESSVMHQVGHSTRVIPPLDEGDAFSSYSGADLMRPVSLPGTPLSAGIASINSRPSGSFVQTKAEPIVLPRPLPNPPTSNMSRPTSEAEENPSDLNTVLGVISRARLNPRERQVVADLTSLFVPNSVATSDLERQGTLSAPPNYTE